MNKKINVAVFTEYEENANNFINAVSNSDSKSVTYKDFEITSNLGRGKKFKYINNEVSIKVDEVKFCQNIFEKIFNVGHIEFLEVGADKHTVYGITHFNIRKQEIENNLK